MSCLEQSSRISQVTWLQAPYTHQIECIHYTTRGTFLRSGPPCTTVSFQGNTCTTVSIVRRHRPNKVNSRCAVQQPGLYPVSGQYLAATGRWVTRCCQANNSRLCKCSSKHKCLEVSSPGTARLQSNSRLVSIDHCQCVVASGCHVLRCVGWCAQPAHTSHIHA